MGGDCFNWNKGDKDLFLKKKKTENAINSENSYIKNYRKNSYNNIPLQLQSEYNINSNKTNISHYKQYLDSNNIKKPTAPKKEEKEDKKGRKKGGKKVKKDKKEKDKKFGFKS